MCIVGRYSWSASISVSNSKGDSEALKAAGPNLDSNNYCKYCHSAVAGKSYLAHKTEDDKLIISTH